MKLASTLIVVLGLVSFGCKDAPAPSTTAPATAAVKADQPASQPTPTSFATKPEIGTVAKCSVTGETFTVDEETVSGEHEGRFFPFCCPGCQEDFDADPKKFAEK